MSIYISYIYISFIYIYIFIFTLGLLFTDRLMYMIYVMINMIYIYKDMYDVQTYISLKYFFLCVILGITLAKSLLHLIYI
jgi:hypothetical protein